MTLIKGMQLYKIYFLAVAIALSLSCSGSEESGVLQLDIDAGFGGRLNTGEALVISATGLEPGEFPVMVEVHDSQGIRASQARLTATKDGTIDDVILAYDVGTYGSSGDGRLAPGTFTVKMSTSQGTVEHDVTVVEDPDAPRVWACNQDGDLSNAFTTGEPVYVKAGNLTPGKTYVIWPVSDRRVWNDGDVFESWHDEDPLQFWGEIPEYIEVTADGHGNIGVEQLLPYASKMVTNLTDQFDVVLDAAPYGVFNADTDAVDGRLPTGVVVQDEPGEGHRLAQLACTGEFVYKDHFKEDEPVYIWLNPGSAGKDTKLYVLKYIVSHTENWEDGKSLLDITEGVELDAVQAGCSNEGLVCAWASAELGEYDVIIDMNANGIYDMGTDVLDGGPWGPGFDVTPQQ